MGNNYIDQIENKLNALNIKKQEFTSLSSRENQVKKLEKMYDIYIPKDYKEFLLNYDETFFDNEVTYKPIETSPWTSKEGTQVFEGFYGLSSENNLFDKIKDYLNRMPDCMIPIGESPGGNVICIGVRGSYKGKVYFWNHENEREAKIMAGIDVASDDINSYWENIHLVSETFLGFLSDLELINETEKLEVDGVELWLDDELLDD
ncbi:SMI1/KNR4 family protein [Peribacillus frigoritolerans]|uniref:SMI1/KNR4 family protein n=1 Tax=Peribacillus frigoritolerans TaxID=450367 RepID=UPI00222F1D0F|nr:SMI1/KNR4 family protein [Peribacillus frigoritolerans]MDM5312617.1 SMI1/KNR4 family protein [Peribacillus frigoritolerans]UZD46016.1 SMI1/KNR4 family protein [Peribacillus frigoritolerans]